MKPGEKFSASDIGKPSERMNASIIIDVGD